MILTMMDLSLDKILGWYYHTCPFQEDYQRLIKVLQLRNNQH